MDNFDNILANHIQNDKLKSKPSDLVFNELRNRMLINAVATKTKQNSIIPPFSSIFGSNHIAWKISVAAILLISFMGIKQINQNNLYIQSADSTLVQQSLDTLNLQPTDTSFTN
jgi:hypothetical protein